MASPTASLAPRSRSISACPSATGGNFPATALSSPYLPFCKQAVNDLGSLAAMDDSSKAGRDARSAPEAEVAKTIMDWVKAAKGRVAGTTFASNVARGRAVGDAGRLAGREVVVVGRAMERVVQVARETGYLDGVQNFRGADLYGHFPPDKVLALSPVSHGEPRAALARITN